MNFTKMRKGMGSGGGRESWRETDEERKRNEKDKNVKWCGRELTTVLF